MDPSQPTPRTEERLVPLKRLPELGFRVLRLARLLESQPVVGMGPRIVRCQVQRLSVVGEGFVPALEHPQYYADIVVGHVGGGIQLQCTGQDGFGFGQVADSM